jgi:hypothetical protein
MSLPLIKAKYLARAVACSFGTSSKGNHQIAVTFEILDHDEFAGQEITWLGSFTDKTTERTIESLQHMGWQGDDLADLDGLDVNTSARTLPDSVEIVCEPDTYEGETNLKVRWVNKPGAGRFAFKEPLTGQGLKAFAAQMRGAVRGAKAGSGRPSSSSNGSKQAPHPNAPRGYDPSDPF